MSKEKLTKKRIIRRYVLIALAALLLLYAAFVAKCLLIERPAVHTVEEYQSLFCNATISVADDGSVEILPLNAKAEAGIIFYVGAQITPDAYIPLFARLAEKGVACFVPKLRGNLAAIDAHAADDIISAHPEITSWFLSGHSMGGLTASGYAEKHCDVVDGLILIASYPNRNLQESGLSVLSVFGDADGILNKKLYEKRKAWYPADFEEHIISGANHSQFGDYGAQRRDNDAAISPEEQQSQTAEIILDWLNRHISGTAAT